MRSLLDWTRSIWVLAIAALTPDALIKGQPMSTLAADSILSERERALRDALEAHWLSDGDEARRLTDTFERVGAHIHSLSGAITAVSLNAEMLLLHGRGGTQASEAMELATNLRESLVRLRRLVEETKEQLRAARTVDAPQVDPGPVLSEAVAGARERFAGIRWQFAPESGPSIPLRFRGGATALRRLVDHLLINAAEGDGPRMPSSVVVTFRFVPLRQELWLEVRDDGPGFPAAVIERPPAPFTSFKTNRVGLGLYSCHRLAVANSGQLALENPSGGGAMARLQLPVNGFGA
jgi:two-component system C4-dicarboxylate transport sensor histidine kinase DctB